MRFFTAYSLAHEYRYLPGFSKFLLEHHLSDFVEEQYKNSLEADLPILKQLQHLSKEELIAFSTISISEYLEYLADNRARQYLELSLTRWKNDELGIIGKFEIMAEDLNLINYVRNKSFRHFIPTYTNDLQIALDLMDELDSFLSGSTIAATNTYISLLKERIASHERNLLEAQALSHIGSFERNFTTGEVRNSPELFSIFDMKEGTSYDEFMNYVHPDDKEKVLAAISESLNTGLYECEYRYVKKGTVKNIWSKGVVTFEDNVPVKFFGTVQDVTERKVFEQLLMNNAAALERSNESLQQFAYVASHDLKEPLRKVSMLTDRVLQQEKDLSVPSLEKLEKIQRSAERLRQMIDDILAYSTLQQWEEKKMTGLQQIVSESLELLEQSIEEKKAIIEAKDLPEALIVPAQFRQLFQNLIGNALKFSKPDHQPVISITHKWLRSQEVTAHDLPAAPKYLQVSIQDNGIGFDQEFARKIFLLFSRLNNKNDYEGSGIGLAIAKKIIDNHNGIIFASSQPNKGSVFTFIIPQESVQSE